MITFVFLLIMNLETGIITNTGDVFFSMEDCGKYIATADIEEGKVLHCSIPIKIIQ